MNDILFFSNNKNKINEVNNFFSHPLLNILNLNDYGKVLSPVENGLSFEKNAKIKSSYGLNKFNKICFADDSGICIEALNDKPGIDSKKFLNSEKNTKIVLKKIIDIAKNKNNFNAFFQTTICLSISKNDHHYFTSKINGEISESIRGSFGFGYDPIFIPQNHKLTYSEMTLKEKNSISHRAFALKKLKKFLLSII